MPGQMLKLKGRNGEKPGAEKNAKSDREKSHKGDLGEPPRAHYSALEVGLRGQREKRETKPDESATRKAVKVQVTRRPQRRPGAQDE